MNLVGKLTLFAGLLTSLPVRCHATQFDPPATDIVPSIIVTVDLSTALTFIYTYKIISGSTSLQDINHFSIRVGTTSVVQTIQNPPGWVSVSNTFGTTGDILWGGIASARIKPGTSKGGFLVSSPNPPDVRDSRSRGFVHVEPVPFVDENTPAPRDPEIDSVHVPTVGPSTFTFTNPLSAVDRLISLEHQASTLGWLGGKEFVEELDEKLDQARKALSQGKGFKARKKLEQFIKKLEDQRKEQMERQHEVSEKGKQEREEHSKDDKRFLTDNAFFLLKPNAQFILSKLPQKPKDRDEEEDDEK